MSYPMHLSPNKYEHTGTQKERPRMFKSSMIGWFCLLSMCITIVIPWKVMAEPELPKADRVVVRKARRQLLLMRGERILFSFDIVLGDAPEGDKLEEGDWRTPEGSYIIDWRNDHSRYYKSMHISYPSPQYIRESAAASMDPGGMIMLHGYPPGAETKPEKYAGRDWTNGCIALKNADMDIVWSLVDDGTPIDILP